MTHEAPVPSRPAYPLPRTGVGVDVHAYDEDPAPDAVLHLAGLAWPGERPLAGHSDADVAAHAAADALLSAAGLGDLGSNFGTAEPQWAGAAGATLLAEAARRVRARASRSGTSRCRSSGTGRAWVSGGPRPRPCSRRRPVGR